MVLTHPISVDGAPRPEGGHVVLEGVRMEFSDRVILRDLDCDFPAGKISIICGGSGSGKSTTLRLIGGLIRPQQGHIRVDGIDVAALRRTSELEKVRQKLGMLFQKGALLDSTNVFDNVAFPLRERTKLDGDEISARVRECLLEVGLKPADERLLPSELSGGMVKRVALARAIVTEPVILLVDEPFSGLDPITSRRIELLLQKVNKRSGITMIIVSHDPGSTMRLADHLLVMLPDRYVQGTPDELRNHEDPRVTSLLTHEVDDSILEVDHMLDTVIQRGPTDLDSTWA